MSSCRASDSTARTRARASAADAEAINDRQLFVVRGQLLFDICYLILVLCLSLRGCLLIVLQLFVVRGQLLFDICYLILVLCLSLRGCLLIVLQCARLLRVGCVRGRARECRR